MLFPLVLQTSFCRDDTWWGESTSDTNIVISLENSEVNVMPENVLPEFPAAARISDTLWLQVLEGGSSQALLLHNHVFLSS